MEKKKFIIALSVITAILVIAAIVVVCVVCLAPDYTELCKQLNAKLKLPYSATSIVVSTEKNSETLNSIFNVTKSSDGSSTVNYSIEKLALFDNTTIPENYKTVSKGSVTVKDGVVISHSGDSADNVELAATSYLGMHFGNSFFSDVNSESGVFTAKVNRPQDFTGNDGLNCTAGSMKVTVNYGEALESITLRYLTTDGATVNVVYIFTV